MASFPNTVRTFSTKQNIIHVVDESHPNLMQDEITAIETVLGTMPHVSLFRAPANGGPSGGNYVTVRQRLEGIEADYRLKSDHDTHSLLLGLTGDDHTQYIKVDGTRAFTGLTAMAAAPIATAPGDTQAAGTALTLARSDHRHAHAAAAAGASAVGDNAAEGVAASVARSDHRHGREGFGAVVAETDFGQASANGSAATVARSDHTHGTPSLSSTTPAAETVGVAGAVGVATTAARADHVHGMPAFGGTVVAEQGYGQAPSVGVATTVARSDHTHGTPDISVTGPTGVIVAYGGDAAPVGWLLCNGAAVSRTTYAALFAAIGTRWGTGDGSTTFNVPGLNNAGRYLRGATTSGATGAGPTHAHADTATTAATTHTHTASSASEAAHTHWVGGNSGWTSHDHGHGIGGSVSDASSASTHGNHIHGVEIASGLQSQNHAHQVASGSGSVVLTAGVDTNHQHQISGSTGYPVGAPSHGHGFSGWSGGQDTNHYHGIGFTSGAGSGHSHGVTVNNEVAHVHTVTITPATTSVVPTADVVYIIKI